MDRTKDILNSINQTVSNSAQKTYKGQKRSDLKDSDFLFPETRSFPIVSPQDVPDSISNFGRMKGKMSYDAFLKKLYNKIKNKPEFVAALPEASKEQLGIKKKVTKAEEDLTEDETPEIELEEYKNDFYEMSLGSIKAIAVHAQAILDSLDNPSVKEGLTESFLQGKIAITEDYMGMIHDYLMFSESEDDDSVEASKKKKKSKMPPFAPPLEQSSPSQSPPASPTVPAISEAGKPGLWDNIRKKKEREGKKYRPAKPGEKDRPDPEQWKKLTKKQ
jgi:hypothetical protein